MVLVQKNMVLVQKKQDFFCCTTIFLYHNNNELNVEEPEYQNNIIKIQIVEPKKCRSRPPKVSSAFDVDNIDTLETI